MLPFDEVKETWRCTNLCKQHRCMHFNLNQKNEQTNKKFNTSKSSPPVISDRIKMSVGKMFIHLPFQVTILFWKERIKKLYVEDLVIFL